MSIDDNVRASLRCHIFGSDAGLPHGRHPVII